MDFESIGMAMGYRRNMDSLADQANAEISKANAEIRRLRDELKEANRRNDSLKTENAKLLAALHVESAFVDGKKAQVDILRAELAKVHPGHQIFKLTGRKYVEGSQVHTNLSVIFEQAFDRSLGKIVPNPQNFRPKTK